MPRHSSDLPPPISLSGANMQTDQKTNDSSASSQDGLASSNALPASPCSDIAAQSIGLLSITDLPDELLLNIFENATYSADIRNILLTCRRFCSTSSHLLLDCLDVCLTEASLARAREISCHPTIFRGIRIVHISLQSHPFVQDDLYFLGVGIFDLRISIDRVTRNQQEALESGNFSSPAEFQSILSERKRLLGSLVQMQRTKRTSYSAHQHSLDRDVLRPAYEKYRKTREWQQRTIADGTFAQELAAAVRRMPKPVKLLFTDRYRHWERSFKSRMMHWMDRTSLVDILNESVSLRLRQRPWLGGGCDSTPLAVQVPLAIHAAGSSTVDLAVQFFCSPMSPMVIDVHDQNQASCLKVAAENLKVFTFEDHTDYLSTARTFCAFSTYFGIVSGAGKLAALTVSLKPMPKRRYTSQPECRYIGSLLASFRWPHLREINLTGVPFHLTDLKSFIEKLRPEACVALNYTYLLSGTWAEGLDLLRTRANAGSWVDSLTGAECHSISSDQLGQIFDGEKASWASQYVQGAPIRNPFLVTEDETVNGGMDIGPI